MRKGILAALAVCTVSAAAAKPAPQSPIVDRCAAYMGQTVAPVSFEQAVARLPNIAPKGEFETTAQYEARKAAATGGNSGPIVILKVLDDRKELVYDADKQQLAISSYAFRNYRFDDWRALYSGAASSLNPSTTDNVDVVISHSETPAGTFEAQNAYGAKATVMKVTRKIAAIFERPMDYDRDGLFADLFLAAGQDHVAGVLDMTPEQAQRLKPLLKLAFVVQPKEPYIVHNSYRVGETTVSNPIQITEDATVLIADIQCGLVLDPANKVLGAYPTR